MRIQGTGETAPGSLQGGQVPPATHRTLVFPNPVWRDN
jgi:hypothetical protein